MNGYLIDMYQATGIDPVDHIDEEDIPFDEDDIPVEDQEITEARNCGFQAGVAASSARIVQVMGAPGIAGNGRRMAIALDLAAKALDMSADAVAAYVCGLAPEANEHQVSTSMDEYEGTVSRLGGLVLSGMLQAASRRGAADMAKIDQKAIYEARRKQTAAGDVSEDGSSVAGENSPAAALPDPAKVYAARRDRRSE